MVKSQKSKIKSQKVKRSEGQKVDPHFTPPGRSECRHATVRGLILSFTVATAAGAAPKITDLFVPSSPYPCFRQPGLIRAGLCCSHSPKPQRVELRAGVGAFQPGENEVGSLQLRRSADGGTSWTDMQEIHVGNIDFYTGVFDANNNRTFLMLQSQDSVLVFESGDMGTTWSKPKSLSGVTPPPPFSKTLKPTVGHGIQIDRSLCSGGDCDSPGGLRCLLSARTHLQRLVKTKALALVATPVLSSLMTMARRGRSVASASLAPAKHRLCSSATNRIRRLYCTSMSEISARFQATAWSRRHLTVGSHSGLLALTRRCALP